ncbi:YkgJ family cysteine cluster protein [Parahaliea sp. F7430]|uniref:YkgJ family cysteine cluster protein n=1 Tax=Sediminihaliea albiluteola TaxID=2758564 RepID=A0A7W2TW72_9GAMM|nr:YkgJ family cysteine cluster protein [Sediminihaliea albiluteola]MBA6413080.1 YkgJ family cysteine cluster protein [Sediminihaliea albiluteola]
MQCRAACGACCIAPSIARPFYGMPEGKPAGVSCVHLSEDYRCQLFGDPRRPALCERFQAEHEVCGDNRSEALAKLSELEVLSLPD